MKILFYRNYVGPALKLRTSVAMSKFASLDAFRGLAAIMIVLFHSNFYAENYYVSFVRHSYIFVDFFFILSGFVMAYSYLDKIAGSKIGFRKFILLRFGRLYPLHLFTLLLWVPYIAVKVILYQRGVGDTDPTDHNNVTTFFYNVLLLQAFHSYLSWNFPSWSISAEFHTYIFFFIFIWTISKTIYSGKLIVSVLLIAAAAYFLLWMMSDGGMELSLFRCIGSFFMGILIFLVYRKSGPVHWNVITATILELTALAFLVYNIANKQAEGLFDNLSFYLSILSFVCVIYLFSVQENGYISRYLKNPVLQILGKLSYSIYMVHAIVLAGIDNLLVYVFKFSKSSFAGSESAIIFNEAHVVNFSVLLIVILFSAFTYRFIEVPWRNRFKKIAEKF